MERRDRSLKALDRLKFVDSLESTARAEGLLDWVNEYLTHTRIEEFDLEFNELKTLSELFYKNINFLKQHRSEMKPSLDSHHKIREFLR